MFKQRFFYILSFLLVGALLPSIAYATPVEVDDITTSIYESASTLPAFMAGISYLAGVLLAVLGILKTIEHVNNPAQTPLRQAAVRFLVGGGLFALPMLMQVAYNTFNGGGPGSVNIHPGDVMQTYSATVGTLTTANDSFNAIMFDAVSSVDNIPNLVSAVAYLLGILLIISGLFKIRDHVDDPNRVSLKEPVIRLIIAGGLFALPVLFEAMYVTMAGNGLGLNATIVNFFTNGGVGAWIAQYSGDATVNTCAGGTINGTGADSIGDVICLAMENSTYFPFLLSCISYILGLVLGVWALIKIRDHVVDPNRTSLWEGVSRLIAGGAFFAMPAIAYAIAYSLRPDGIVAGADATTGFQENITCGTSNSLDMAMACFMQDIIGPTNTIVNFFCFVAGLIFIMIGTSRLIKSAQDGPKGPGGMGTVGTFIVGGILISTTTILSAISESFFDNSQTVTTASLAFTSGMSAAETDATYNVISAVLKFMIIIGMISFVRGIFIMREVAEGNQQASTMAGVTHIVGGALAVNLGPLLNALQSTLGITAFGVTFS